MPHQRNTSTTLSSPTLQAPFSKTTTPSYHHSLNISATISCRLKHPPLPNPKSSTSLTPIPGVGLFTITLSSLFTSSTGIDISNASIISARQNATLNKLPASQCTFIDADAAELFKSVTYPSDETVVVLDPPRKGCDESFLSQLLKFRPRRVVYVSCNVHTQARDVGVLVRGIEHGGTRYKIESLRGFDFFPQQY